jgi:hypothetical protein
VFLLCSWVFSRYYLPERSAKLRCAGRRSGDIIFHSIGRREIIVYLEYQSVCPIVGIGSLQPPSSENECVSPLEGEGVGGPILDWIEGLALSILSESLASVVELK